MVQTKKNIWKKNLSHKRCKNKLTKQLGKKVAMIRSQTAVVKIPET